MMKRLYKGGEVSPLLHPIDAQSWLPLGWSEEKPTQQTQPNGLQKEEKTEAPKGQITREQREAELLSLYYGESGDGANWRAIKAIADPLGITKPDDGWDEAIPLILTAEGY